MRFTSLALLVSLIVSGARADDPKPLETHRAVVVRHHTAGPWIVFGIGWALLVGGLVTELLSQPMTGDSCSSCGPEPPTDSARAGQITGVVGAGTGVAMVIGGMVWHMTEPTGPQVITVGPILSRGAAGFMLRATF